jgi:hypothetical protein
MVVQEEGQAKPIPVEEYKNRLATQLTREAPTLDQFHHRWTRPEERRQLMNHLVEAGFPPACCKYWKR